MARGWESKSVESQQDDARNDHKVMKPRLSAEDAVKERQRRSLELARRRVLQQIENAGNPAYRQILEQSLAELDAQLSRLT
jgi:hypothetical protein